MFTLLGLRRVLGSAAIVFALLAATAVGAMCEAPFHAAPMKLKAAGPSSSRTSMQSEVTRLSRSSTVSPIRIPRSATLQSDPEYQRLSKARSENPQSLSKMSQSDLLRTAMLTAALVQERNFKGVRRLLDPLVLGDPATWEYEVSDQASGWATKPSPNFLKLYMRSARALAAVASGGQTSAQMWSDLATYIGTSGLLNALGASGPFSFGELPPGVSAKVDAEIRRLTSLQRWQVRAELAQVPALLGLGMNAEGQPSIFGESMGQKFNVAASGGGGGIVIGRNEECHHGYGRGFFMVVDRFKKHQDKFELATVIRSGGTLVMQLRPPFAHQAGLADDHFAISASDLSLLDAGKPLPPDSELAAVPRDCATLARRW
jgi:hypothetical protein